MRLAAIQGVLHFYKQLEIGADDELGVWADGRLGNLVRVQPCSGEYFRCLFCVCMCTFPPSCY